MRTRFVVLVVWVKNNSDKRPTNWVLHTPTKIMQISDKLMHHRISARHCTHTNTTNAQICESNANPTRIQSVNGQTISIRIIHHAPSTPFLNLRNEISRDSWQPETLYHEIPNRHSFSFFNWLSKSRNPKLQSCWVDNWAHLFVRMDWKYMVFIIVKPKWTLQFFAKCFYSGHHMT
jgi:hypothetical protein